jgi:hypothetical protein
VILTDNGSIVVADVSALPTTLQTPFTRPLIVESDEHSVQESFVQAPLIIEYVQNAALIVTNDKTAMLVAASGPEGRKGEQGEPGPGILAISWVGDMVQVEYENGETALVPFGGFIDGGDF